MGVSRAEWLWNSIGLLSQNTGNQAKGLLWLVMAEGQISRAGGRGSGKWRMRNKIRVWVLQKENWPLCARLSTILISVPSFKTYFFLFTLVSICFSCSFFYFLNVVSSLLWPIPNFSSYHLCKSEENRFSRRHADWPCPIDLIWFSLTSTQQKELPSYL